VKPVPARCIVAAGRRREAQARHPLDRRGVHTGARGASHGLVR
jgi:hypothetical protein